MVDPNHPQGFGGGSRTALGGGVPFQRLSHKEGGWGFMSGEWTGGSVRPGAWAGGTWRSAPGLAWRTSAPPPSGPPGCSPPPAPAPPSLTSCHWRGGKAPSTKKNAVSYSNREKKVITDVGGKSVDTSNPLPLNNIPKPKNAPSVAQLILPTIFLRIAFSCKKNARQNKFLNITKDIQNLCDTHRKSSLKENIQTE